MSYSFQKIADSWSAMTDSEKHDALEGTKYLKPTTSELVAVGKFRVVSNDKLDVAVKGVPIKQLVVPVELITTSVFEHINTITIDDNVVGGGIVKYAVTVDKVGYFVYNQTAGEWETINGTYNTSTGEYTYHALTSDEVDNNGMTSSQILALTATEWDMICSFIKGSGIGFAYLLDISNPATDTAEVDTITFNADMKGIWKKAVHTTDYTLCYPDSDLLKVTLLTDGSYKINY